MHQLNDCQKQLAKHNLGESFGQQGLVCKVLNTREAMLELAATQYVQM
jgi:hypothetical protein